MTVMYEQTCLAIPAASGEVFGAARGTLTPARPAPDVSAMPAAAD